MKDILLNLQKLTFVGHDTKKQSDQDCADYMVTVQDTLDAPKQFVPMEWDRGLDQSSILSLLYMLHFGTNIAINTCVKNLLVLFHGGFLCLGNPISVDVELIAVITGLPFT